MRLVTSRGLTFAMQVLVGVLFGQLIIAVLNPPANKLNFLAFIVVLDVAIVVILTIAKSHPKR